MEGRTICPSEDHWRVVAASVRGAGHAKTGQPCQDAHHWTLLPGGALAAAVADGAGSAPLAEVGAEVAATAAVEALLKPPPSTPLSRTGEGGRSVLAFPSARTVGVGAQFIAPSSRVLQHPALPETETAWHALLQEALQAALQAIEAAAAQHGMQPRDLATTLILMVATPTQVAAAQVGDGATVVGSEEGDLFALTAPESGEYINETTFLVAPEALDSARIAVWRGTALHLAVLSDGLQRLALKMPCGTPHAPFFAPLFRFAAERTNATEAQEHLAAFLGSPRITQRADDDLTLLLASRTR